MQTETSRITHDLCIETTSFPNTRPRVEYRGTGNGKIYWPNAHYGRDYSVPGIEIHLIYR